VTVAAPRQMMAAVCSGDGRVEVERVPVPEPSADEVLVEVAACGICGSDLHLVFDRHVRPGAVLGHEWSGRVASEDPSGRWHPGDRVVSGPRPGCGRCRPCRRGRPSVCTRRVLSDIRDMRGAFAQFVTVSSATLTRIPDGLRLRQAALAEPVAIALHAVRLSGVVGEDRVLITGAGPVGLIITAVLRARGVTDITVVEPVEARRRRVEAIGATRTVEPGALEAPAPGVAVPGAFAVAFECSGRAAAAASALDQLEAAGTLVFVGTGSEPVAVNHNRMIVLELEALGAFNYDATGFGPALDLLEGGALPLDLLVEAGDVGLDGVMDAMGRLARGELPAKVLVNPEVS